MSDTTKNMDNNNSEDPDFDQFWKKIQPPFKEDKSEVWEKLSKKIDEKSEAKKEVKIISLTWFKVVAACFTVLFVSGVIGAKIYIIEINCAKGEQNTHFLPDGSKIQLNASSSISYAPYWWFMKRNVTLQGEAFFKVKKGKRFTVNSELGNTKVLGTSFNIYARENQYKVFCKTGKVKVNFSKIKKDIILIPNQIVFVNLNNEIEKSENIKENAVIGWLTNQFTFSSIPLNEVFKELERQYDISITFEIPDKNKFTYSGYFEKAKNVDSILEVICLSFDFNFTHTSDNKYVIVSNH